MEIKVDNVTENEDGSCNVDLEYDTEALIEAKIWASGQEGIDIKDDDAVMQAFVISMLEDQIDRDKEETAIESTDK